MPFSDSFTLNPKETGKRGHRVRGIGTGCKAEKARINSSGSGLGCLGLGFRGLGV